MPGTEGKVDVLIVGAGPAGSSAAYQLAKLGMSVLLVDRHEFPRVKACAGGLTKKTLQILPYSVEPIIQRKFSSIDLGDGRGGFVRCEAQRAACAMTVRSEFDDFCLKQARAAGAQFRKIARIDAIAEDGGEVAVVTNEGRLAASFVIGADGANSSVRRLTGIFPRIRKAFAAEVCVPVEKPENYPLTIDFFRAKRGYGWVFPKGNHLNVGLCSIDKRVRIDRPAVEKYIADATGQRDYYGFVSHHLGYGGWDYRVEPGRIFLVGDAAGLAEPSLGEGIYYAVLSGQLVAQAIHEARGDAARTAAAYDAFLEELRGDLRLGDRGARAFYAAPRLGYAAITQRAARSVLMKGFEKGMTVREILRNALVLPFMDRSAVR